MSAITVWFLFVFIPKVGILAGLSLLFLLIWTVVTNIHRAVEEPREDSIEYIRVTRFNNKMKYILPLLCILMASAPDQKQMAAVVIVPYISNNEEIQKIPENLAKKLNDYLTEKKDEK